MALGGYKFAGYKCTKPSDATDAEWALLIHRTRLAAFMKANSLNNAGWEFDYVDYGDYDFTDRDGNLHEKVIFECTTDGLNLVSYFKHGTGDDTKYYLIASLFSWRLSTSGSGSSASLLLSSTGPCLPGYYSSSSNYKIGYKALFHAVSYSRFNMMCLASGETYPSDAISLVPVTNWTTPNSITYVYTLPTTSDLSLKQNQAYFGYIVKGTDIITFTTFDLTQDSTFGIRAKTSLVGFGSMSLSSPSDTANIYGVTFTNASGSESLGSFWSSGALTSYCETLKDDFTQYPASDLNSQIYLTKVGKAVFGGTTTIIPFESVSLTTYASRSASPYLNSDGICSKGTFDINLCACNGRYEYQLMSPWETYANGNYLCIAIQRSYSSSDVQTNYYIGWDPSNPHHD